MCCLCVFCADDDDDEDDIDRLLMQNSNKATANATKRPPINMKKMPATLLSDSSLRASCLSLCLHSVRSYHHLFTSLVMLPFSINDNTARFIGSLYKPKEKQTIATSSKKEYNTKLHNLIYISSMRINNLRAHLKKKEKKSSHLNSCYYLRYIENSFWTFAMESRRDTQWTINISVHTHTHTPRTLQ